ncbi:type II secretion system protein N [Oceaniovalibus sp. ACAM 378]|uniref:type II secretion system protein N n=1 Tax=Oceaniovalibus sp. ACAM 378 TaxID=2599923 RepID=UPI00165229DA|nr:type II secretion system protein N [Oceaniovalibus sp. ACAM 378]
MFAGTVLLTAPASVIARMGQVPPQVLGLSGTLWSGQARLDGGLSLAWQGNWRSIPARLRLESGLSVTGPGTLLTGTAFAGFGQTGLRDLSGRAGAEVLALLPGAAPCNGQAVVDVTQASWSRDGVIGLGRIRIGESRCQPVGGRAFQAPALNLDLTTEPPEAVATLTTDDASRTVMATARLTSRGRIRLRIEPAGARIVPGLPSSGPTELEFQLD